VALCIGRKQHGMRSRCSNDGMKGHAFTQVIAAFSMMTGTADCSCGCASLPNAFSDITACPASAAASCYSQVDAVELHGVSSRFCQQCGKFHELNQFDGLRHSCRCAFSVYLCSCAAAMMSLTEERISAAPASSYAYTCASVACVRVRERAAALILHAHHLTNSKHTLPLLLPWI
jgi:hypothetical protein